MEMELGFYANRIVMLYSIEDENMGVVRRLHEHVEPLVTLHKELTFETICVDTAADLFGTLSNLASSVKYKGIPLLHLDMHGDPIRGVKLLSGEYVPWIDLSKKLGTINFQTGNRMAVISAACAGMSVINPPRINDPAPFKCLFSCSENITLGDIQDDLFTFYTKLLADSDLKGAIESLSRAFSDFWPEKALFHIIRESIFRYEGRAGSHAREATLSYVLNNLPDRLSIEKKMIRGKLKKYSDDFDDNALKRLTHEFLCGQSPFFDVRELKDAKYANY